MENESFNVFLGEKLRDKNISLERLSELSGIAEKHLENLLKGDQEKLPPAPYLHGYFIKLGSILDFDGNTAWQEWLRNAEIKKSGATDKLPENRFKKKSISRYIWGAVLLVLILAYGTFQLSSRIFGTPRLSITNPKMDMSNSSYDRITLNGKLENAKDLSINGEPIPLGDNGDWQKEVLLQPGLNTIQIVAKKFLGGEVDAIRQVFYEPPVTASSTATSTKKSL